MLEPTEGILTFRAEGNNIRSSRDYSRKIHWPGNSAACMQEASGVTVGRGFDLGDRSKKEALLMLKKAGVETEKAKAIANGARLKGCAAYKFVKENRASIEEISEEQQLKLFALTWAEIKKDVERICKKRETIVAYHPNTDISPEKAWDNIPEKIKLLLIDLRYRGDYAPWSRKYLQQLAYKGDIEGFGRIISDRKIWSNVSVDRFNMRVEYYENN